MVVAVVAMVVAVVAVVTTVLVVAVGCTPRCEELGGAVACFHCRLD